MEDRFHSQYIPEPNSGCWLWEGMSWANYGYFHLQGKDCRAHRVAYELKNGPIPSGKMVLHICDTPLCVNPDHLVLGSHKDNMRDMKSKNRQAKGVTHNSNKLTENEVISIRSDRRSHRIIALEYGVSHYMIGAIKRRNLWRHLP
jgi:hypothetical protein